MIENLAKSAQPILDIAFIRRTRRNHGLEHASVHVLGAKTNVRPLAGRSDAAGFWLLGDLETPDVEAAVSEALRRLRAGERTLAVHPGCGTARLTTGTMAGLAALAGTIGVRRNLSSYVQRAPTVIALAMGAIFLSEPLGLQLQEHFTTLGDPGDLEVTHIERKTINNPLGGTLTMHRISTTSS